MELRKIISKVAMNIVATVLFVLSIEGNINIFISQVDVYASETYTSGLWVYEKYKDGTIGIAGYSGFEEDLQIPTELDGLIVTEISPKAFYENTNVKKVAIPSTVKRIGYYAFAGSGLTSITIPETVTSWGITEKYSTEKLPSGVTVGYANAAFAECENLKEVQFNAQIIPSHAFWNCEKISKVTLGRKVGYIQDKAFEGDSNMSFFSVNSELYEIGNRSFYNCKKMKQINLGNSLQSVGYFAFAGSGLTSITVPESVTTWYLSEKYYTEDNVLPSGIKVGYANAAFAECSNLKEVYFNTQIIPSLAFMNCENLSKVTLGKEVKYIEDKAFEGDASISVLSVNSELYEIGNRSFYNCEKMKQINLGNSLESIGYFAFAGSGLTSITVPESLETWWLSEKYYTDDNVLPSGTKAGYQNAAFAECMNLKKVNIGKVYIPSDILYNTKTATIHTMKNTFAHTYAIENGISYKLYDAIPSTSIKMQRSAYTLVKGDSLQLYPSLLPQNTTDKITWTSGNSDIATINEKNIVEAKGTGLVAFKGTTTSGKTCSFTINVVNSGTTTYDTKTAKNIALSTISGSEKATYTGKAIQTKVSVFFNPCTELIPDVDYTISYKNNISVGKATVTITGKGNYAGTKSMEFTIVPSKVLSLQQTKVYSTSSINMTWKAVNGATGYLIYRGNTKNGTYKLLKTVKTNSYTHSSVAAGSKYYYKVCAYKEVNGSRIYGAFSESKSMITKPLTPTVKLTAGKKRIKVSWTKSQGANGYEVYMSTSRNGKYTKIKSANSLQLQYTKSGLSVGKIYYTKVRAYKKTGMGVKVYTDYSSIISAKVL